VNYLTNCAQCGSTWESHQPHRPIVDACPGCRSVDLTSERTQYAPLRWFATLNR